MKKAIEKFIIQFLLDRLGIEADSKTRMNCLTDEQLDQLLKGLQEEFKVQLRLSDILWYIQVYQLNVEDLSSVTFTKIVG